LNFNWNINVYKKKFIFKSTSCYKPTKTGTQLKALIFLNKIYLMKTNRLCCFKASSKTKGILPYSTHLNWPSIVTSEIYFPRHLKKFLIAMTNLWLRNIVNGEANKKRRKIHCLVEKFRVMLMFLRHSTFTFVYNSMRGIRFSDGWALGDFVAKWKTQTLFNLNVTSRPAAFAIWLITIAGGKLNLFLIYFPIYFKHQLFL